MINYDPLNKDNSFIQVIVMLITDDGIMELSMLQSVDALANDGKTILLRITNALRCSFQNCGTLKIIVAILEERKLNHGATQQTNSSDGKNVLFSFVVSHTKVFFLSHSRLK